MKQVARILREELALPRSCATSGLDDIHVLTAA